MRYVDTLCQMHGIPPIAYGLQYADGRPLVDISAGVVVARGGKSIMMELPGCDNTFKVSCPASAILGFSGVQRFFTLRWWAHSQDTVCRWRRMI